MNVKLPLGLEDVLRGGEMDIRAWLDAFEDVLRHRALSAKMIG